MAKPIPRVRMAVRETRGDRIRARTALIAAMVRFPARRHAMNLRVMHAVDYWVGIPLCMAVSAFEKVRSAFSSASPSPPKRLLFIELSEMGSAVLAYPAIKEAVDRLGAENVWFMIFERNREGVSVLNLLPDDHIVTVSDRSLGEFTRTVLQALGRCRKAGI